MIKEWSKGVVLCFLQVQLYEDFAKSRVKKGLDDSVSQIDGDNDDNARKETPHIFQVLFSLLHFIGQLILEPLVFRIHEVLPQFWP